MEKMRLVLRHVKSQNQWESGTNIYWEAGDLLMELKRDFGDRTIYSNWSSKT